LGYQFLRLQIHNQIDVDYGSSKYESIRFI